MVYTTCIGARDIGPPTLKQRMPDVDYVCFTEPDALYAQAWHDWDLRLAWPVASCATRAARFHKLQPHVVLPGYDWWIWIDACTDDLGDLSLAVASDMTVLRHAERDCVYDELDVCVQRRRIPSYVAAWQAEAYARRGLPRRSGLFVTTMLGRRNVGAVVALNDAWWRELSLFSTRDQVSLPMVCRDQGFVPQVLDGTSEQNPWFRWRLASHGETPYDDIAVDACAQRHISGRRVWAAHVAYEEQQLNELTGTPEYTSNWTEWYKRHLPILHNERPGFAPRDYLEIGVWEGRSVHAACEVFPTIDRLVAVDTWDTPERRRRAERNIALLSARLSAELIQQDSKTALPALEDAGRTFDMIYVDGSHAENDVYVDSRYAWRLLRPGGLIIWDDLPLDRPDEKTLGAVEAGVRRFLEREGIPFNEARYTGWQYSMWKP